MILHTVSFHFVYADGLPQMLLRVQQIGTLGRLRRNVGILLRVTEFALAPPLRSRTAVFNSPWYAETSRFNPFR